MDGRGSSSYIDDVILREREDGTSWTGSSTASLTNRLYYLQNWRHDVVALVTPACGIIERTRYTSYGMPSTMTGGDFDHNLVVDDDDFLLFQDPYTNIEQVDYRASTDRTGEFSEYDLDGDGEVGDGDFGVFVVAYGRFNCALPGELSHRDANPASDIGNRIGYAGYGWNQNTSKYNVRYRVYEPIIGTWLTRDPAGYRPGLNLFEYVNSRVLTATDPDGRNPAAIAIGIGVLVPMAAAAYLCMKPFLDYAENNYPNVNDKFKHCWVSSQASRTCGGVLAALGGLSKEALVQIQSILMDYYPTDGTKWDYFIDSINDLKANESCIMWESILFGPLGGLVSRCFRESPHDCCASKWGTGPG